jgi:hypothetical protein
MACYKWPHKLGSFNLLLAAKIAEELDASPKPGM